MINALNVEQINLGIENPDVALRKGISRAGETVKNLKRAHAGSGVVLRGAGCPDGDGMQLRRSSSVRS